MTVFTKRLLKYPICVMLSGEKGDLPGFEINEAFFSYDCFKKIMRFVGIV